MSPLRCAALGFAATLLATPLVAAVPATASDGATDGVIGGPALASTGLTLQRTSGTPPLP